MNVPIVGMVIVGVVAIVAIVYGCRFSFRARVHGERFRIDVAKEYGQAKSSGNDRV